jgi:AraC-like DNA-binding protein
VEWDLRLAATGRIGADQLTHTGTVRAVVPPLTSFVVSTALRGAMRVSVGAETLHMEPGTVVHNPAAVAMRTESTDFSVATIRIPRREIDRVAEERCGVPIGSLTFDGLTTLSQAAARQWRRLDAFLQHEIRSPRSLMDAPLMEQQFLDLIAATILTTFPNTTTTAEPGYDASVAGAATVRRAVEFIEAHAAEPLTLTAIADAAAISPRAVQLAFRRHTALTPMQYLRMVRLEHAHQDLRAADPASGLTIAAVAARAGFGRAARFSSYYQQRYGVSPHETLRS